MIKEIKLLDLSQLSQLSEFFCRLSSYDRGMKFMSWSYLIQAKNFHTYCAFINNKIVGAVTVLERELVLGEEIIKCGLSVHAIIDPDIKDQVSIFELTKPLYKYCSQKGMKLILGFPNKNYSFIQEKIDKFKEIKKFKSLVLSSLTSFEIAENISFKELDDPYHLAFNLSLHKERHGSVQFQRSPGEILNRTILNPESKYTFWEVAKGGEIIGTVILKDYFKDNVRTIHLIDYFLDEKHDLEAIVKQLVNIFRERCDQFVFWPLENRLHEILIRCCFKEIGFETYFGCKNLTLEKEKFERVIDFSNWRLSMLDSDVF